MITVCDKAREACPVFPRHPVLAHWGMPDPASVVGSDATIRTAFADALRLVSRCVDLMLALPAEKLEHLVLQGRIRRIAEEARSPAEEATS